MTQRTCGTCQLCCRLLPVEEFGKGAGERCKHQRAGKGCAIHSTKPLSCSVWNCRWLVGDDTEDQPRPDRAGLVIDVMPDILGVTNNATGEKRMVPCIVVWCDPRDRDAYKREPFRRYVQRQKCPVLVRFDSYDGVTLMPPFCTGQDSIIEFDSKADPNSLPSTMNEKAAVLGATLAMPGDDEDLGVTTMTMPDGSKISVATKWRE